MHQVFPNLGVNFVDHQSRPVSPTGASSPRSRSEPVISVRPWITINDMRSTSSATWACFRTRWESALVVRHDSPGINQAKVMSAMFGFFAVDPIPCDSGLVSHNRSPLAKIR